MSNNCNIKYPNVLTQELDFYKILGRTKINLDSSALKDEFYGKTILITGAAGSIGKNIVLQLIQFQPKLLVLLDHSESGMFELQQNLESENFKDYSCQICDIRNSKRVQFLFEFFHPEYVFHAAAYKHVPLMENNPYEAVSTNVLGTQNLVNFSISYGVKKFVFISSDKAVNPANVMGASKRLGELYIAANQSKTSTIFITTRFANVVGSSGSIVPILKNQISKGGPITITHAEATRYFLTMEEAIFLVLESTSSALVTQMFLFEMERPILIMDLAKKMVLSYGIPLNEINIKICGLRPGEKIHEEINYSNATHFGSPSNRLYTISEKIIDKETMNSKINEFSKELDSLNHLEIVSNLKSLIPEYISINSKYDILDNKD